MNLKKSSREEYSGNYDDHYFEQYKLFLESIEKISDHRQRAIGFFFVVNTLIVSMLTFVVNGSFDDAGYLVGALSLIGIFLCFVFGVLINSYKQLNTGKFKVLHEIESELPLALYEYEWHVLCEGKEKKVYYPFSHIEIVIPWVFGTVYLLFFLDIIFSLL